MKILQNLRHQFISSFRARLLIIITLSYVIAYIISGGIVYFSHNFEILPLSLELKNILMTGITFVIFMFIFFKLMKSTMRYLNDLSESIQEVSYGNYEQNLDIEYDDELGMLAANINGLAKTLKDAEIEAAILRENERLAYDAERKAEQQKNDIITNVAHDLRTPLTSIIGYLDLIKESHDLTNEQVHQYSEVAYTKAIRLQSMMDDLFEFTKLDHAGIKMHLHTINISELLMQLIDEFYPNFQEHHVSPVIDIKNLELYVRGDGQLLARVFENLISNALKYGYDDSQLKIQIVEDEKTITIKIMNQGQNISEKDLPNLFEKFYRSDESRGTSQGGTGLGLAIAKQIVEMHKGQILVTSMNEVTTFIVRLPRYHNPA